MPLPDLLITYLHFYIIWKKALRRAALTEAVLDEGARTYEPLRPHDCRHIYAMLAERASLMRTKVQKAGLGHARLAQTLDYTDRETAFTTGEMRTIDGVLSSEAESMPVKQAG